MKEAIRDMFKRYKDFKGYSSRKQYICGFLSFIFPALILSLFAAYGAIANYLNITNYDGYVPVYSELRTYIFAIGGIVCVIWYPATIIPMLALTARRIRSAGWSQWTWILLFIPYIDYFFIIALCAIPNEDDSIFEDDAKTDKKNKNTNTKNKKKKNSNNYKINKFTLAMCLIGILIVILLGFQLFGNSYNFIENMHGKSICSKIAKEFNKTQRGFYIDEKGGTIVEYPLFDLLYEVIAIDSEHKYIKKNDNHSCKIWIKGKRLIDKPYIAIISHFNLLDKHNAPLDWSGREIKIKVTPNETVSLTFDFYKDSIKDAENVVFSHNDHYLPMDEEDYCQAVLKLDKEAKETYKYEYNDFLSCDCEPPSRYSYKYDSKCKIFNNDELRQNCISLSKLVPTCNEYIKKTENKKQEQKKQYKDDDKQKILKESADSNNPKKQNTNNDVNNTNHSNDCTTFSDCKSNFQKSKYCRCIDYELNKNNPNTILAPQPRECVDFCKNEWDIWATE